MDTHQQDKQPIVTSLQPTTAAPEKKKKEEKPCRVCNSGQEFLNFAKQKKQNPSKVISSGMTPRIPYTPFPCPADSQELGSSTWTFLHTMSVYYPEAPTAFQESNMLTFLSSFSKIYPCEDCASHLRTFMHSNPPVVKDARGLSTWLCRAHNEVNERLGKELFDCSKVFERWMNGTPGTDCEQ